MKIRIAFGTIAIMFILALPVYAGGKGELQKYFSSTAARVKATNNPVEKREILNRSLSDMSKALGIAENLPLVSEKDRKGIENFKAKLQEKQDELSGSNGFVRVQDKQLNSFSDYVVQDTEQAEVITISLVALLLIILIVLLIV
jgi:hypothetical protein